MPQNPFLTFHEVLRLLQVIFGVIILLCVSELIRRRFYFSSEFGRKFIHVGVGVFVFFSPLLFQRKNAVLVLAFLFIFVDLLAYRRGWLRAMHPGNRASFGTVYYPLSILLLAFFLWDHSPALFVAALMMMIVGDASAGIVGELWTRPAVYALSSDKKSLQGSGAMFAGGVIALGATALFYGPGKSVAFPVTAGDPLHLLLPFLCISLFATAWEAISSRGLDNLTVPLASALALHVCFSMGGYLTERFLLATLLSLCISLLSILFRWLRPSGAVAVYILATIIFSAGSWTWSVPILAFFVFSSLLSRAGARVKNRAAEIVARDGRRDWIQVTANGMVAGFLAILSLLFPHPAWYVAYIGAVAAATSDTWATELGMLAGKPPWNLLTGKPETPGTSGAVSLPGFLGAAAGAMCISAGGALFAFPGLQPFRTAIVFLLLCAVGGMAGSLVDSILGASLQAIHRCASCGKETEKKEHCGLPTTLSRGVRWMDNDMVNLLCTAAGALVAGLCALFILF